MVQWSLIYTPVEKSLAVKFLKLFGNLKHPNISCYLTSLDIGFLHYVSQVTTVMGTNVQVTLVTVTFILPKTLKLLNQLWPNFKCWIILPQVSVKWCLTKPISDKYLVTIWGRGIERLVPLFSYYHTFQGQTSTLHHTAAYCQSNVNLEKECL